MRYAKAMYLGGEYLSAEQCNYESAKEYGLVCPLCSSAVFLRGQGIRCNTLRNGKKQLQIINPYFAHYHTGVDDFDCELRASRSFSEEVIRLAEIEAKQQRLKLYNKHLIRMHKQDHNNYTIDKKFRRLRKIFTKTWQETILIKIRQLVASDPELYLFAISEDELLEFATMPLEEKQEMISKVSKNADKLKEQIAEEDNLWLDYLSRHQISLHSAIVKEIADFTFTRTGGYFLKYLIDSTISNYCCFAPASVVRYNIPLDYLILGILRTINRTRWLDVIPLYLANEDEQDEEESKKALVSLTKYK